MDDEGFLHITGRLSRFSKIGGEMVPHLRIEEELMKVLGDDPEDEKIQVCVTAVPDEKKGERLIVLYLKTAVTVDQMRAALSLPGCQICLCRALTAFLKSNKSLSLGLAN